MLNKLPPKVMEGIMERLNAEDYRQLAGVSPKMWKIVEETPKKHQSVKVFSDPKQWGLGFVDLDSLSNRVLMLLELSALPRWAFKDDRPTLQMPASNSRKERIARSSFLRLFLNNATCQELFDAPLSFGNKFWCSLNTKVVRVCNPTDVTIAKLQEFLDHFKPPEFLYDTFSKIVAKEPEEYLGFVKSPSVCSLEMLHFQSGFCPLNLLHDLRAKDLFIQAIVEPTLTDWDTLLKFVMIKAMMWIREMVDIDKIQILIGDLMPEAVHKFRIVDFIEALAIALRDRLDLGWVDRTYEGLNLILRARDGQALVVYWDDVDNALFLLRTEYNFRRGRCFGSYERNAKALTRICELMRKCQIQAERNPLHVDETKEKLTQECAKFNEYNRGATGLDLMIDAIWRSKAKRVSPWRRFGPEGTILRRPMYPLDVSLGHGYQFAKAFETMGGGVLPDVDEFKPACFVHSVVWSQVYQDLYV